MGVVAEHFVELGAGLHQVGHATLGTLGAHCLIDFYRCLTHRTKGTERIERQPHVGALQLLHGEKRGFPKLGEVRQHRVGEGAILVQAC